MDEDLTKPRRKRLAWIYWGIFLIVLTAAVLFWFFFLRFIAYTSDAYVQGNQVYITPLVSGFIKAIHTDDTYFVKKGQLLIELDVTDARIQSNLNKKRLSQVVREVCQLFHQVFVYHAELKVRKAELIRSIQDYQHRHGVLDIEGNWIKIVQRLPVRVELDQKELKLHRSIICGQIFHSLILASTTHDS